MDHLPSLLKNDDSAKVSRHRFNVYEKAKEKNYKTKNA